MDVVISAKDPEAVEVVGSGHWASRSQLGEKRAGVSGYLRISELKPDRWHLLWLRIILGARGIVVA
jgi:hypothetical protein